MKYAFTIIIPHKNIPQLLRNCLNSIPKRNDLHIIVVDDNSDSTKVNFNEFPGLNDSYVEVIFTKENKGAGYARNVALQKTDSKWVLFADADDFYTDELNTFLDKYVNTDYDVIFFENNTIDIENGQLLDKDLMVKDLLKECKEKGNLDPLRYKSYAPWTKLIRMSLITSHNIRFDELPAANDSMFSVKVGHFAKKIAIDEHIIYTRTIRQGSLFYSLNKKNLLARIECGYRVNAFLKKYNKVKEYHSETWGHFLDLRKISWLLFLRTSLTYFARTPFFITKNHILYTLTKKTRMKK